MSLAKEILHGVHIQGYTILIPAWYLNNPIYITRGKEAIAIATLYNKKNSEACKHIRESTCII